MEIEVKKCNSSIRICLACNDEYTKHCAQVIASVIANHKTCEKLEFYILHSRISKNNLKKLKKMEKQQIAEIFPLKIDSSIFRKCPVPDDMYYSLEAYYRLCIPEIFPDFEKIIYLDSDVSVLGDIKELWDLDISDYYAAACLEFSKTVHLSKFMNSELYFNSGVMVINCNKWREDNIFNKSLEFVKTNASSIIYVEQDVLNSLLSEKIFHINRRWNFEYMPFNSAIFDLCAENEISLVHYVSRWKPWNKYGHHFASFYFRYLSKTPWFADVVLIRLKLFINYVFRPVILLKYKKELEKTVKNRKAVLWGASLFITKMIEKLGLKTDDILGIIDVNPEKSGQKIGKYKIFPPKELKKLNPDLIISAVVGRPKMKESIGKELENQGLCVEINDSLFCEVGED